MTAVLVALTLLLALIVCLQRMTIEELVDDLERLERDVAVDELNRKVAG